MRPLPVLAERLIADVRCAGGKMGCITKALKYSVWGMIGGCTVAQRRVIETN
jgi:hypothetical protein